MSEATFIPLYTGDTNDDDGQIIDEMFKPNPVPPEPTGTAAVVHREEKPKKPTRLLCNSITIPAGATLIDPVQIAWSDIHRKALTVAIIGAAADFIYIADETTKLAGVTPTGSRMAARVNSSLLPTTFSEYTGPLWIKTDTTVMSGALTVEVMSVTE